MSDPELYDLFAEEPLTTALFRYWDEQRLGRAVPDRRDIDPVDIDRRILPYVTLYDLFDGGKRARARLIGTSLLPYLGGSDPTGRFVDEFLPPAQVAYFTSITIDVCQNRCPIYSVDWHVSLDRQNFVVKRLVLPLTRGGSTITQIFGISRHVPSTEAELIAACGAGIDTLGPSPEHKELIRVRIRDGRVEPAGAG